MSVVADDSVTEGSWIKRATITSEDRFIFVSTSIQLMNDPFVAYLSLYVLIISKLGHLAKCGRWHSTHHLIWISNSWLTQVEKTTSVDY